MPFLRAAAGVIAAAAVTVTAATSTATAEPAAPITMPLTTVTSESGVPVVGREVRAVALDASKPAPVIGGILNNPTLTWLPGLQDMLTKGVPVSLRNGDRAAPVLVQVASPQENKDAMANFTSILSVGTGVGSILGIGAGAVVGCIVGGIIIPVIGCIPGFITGGTVGGIIGTVTGGGTGVAAAAMDLVQTLNAPDGTTRYYVKPVAPAAAPTPAAPAQPAAPAGR